MREAATTAKETIDRPLGRPVNVSPVVKPITTEAPPVTQLLIKPETPNLVTTITDITQTSQNNNKMAWKPKTIAGKILKGAVIAGGSLLGLASGVGVIKGIASGTGIATGAAKGVESIGTVADKLKNGLVRVVTGTTEEERAQINEVKAVAKKEQDKVEQMQRLINAGATEAQARNMVGIEATELKTFQGKPITEAGLFDNPVVKYGVIAAGIFFLAKILKIVK